MKKTLSVLISALFILPFSLSAQTTLKIATISPEGSMWMKTMRKGAAEIAEKTEKRVKIKLYPAGVMGSNEVVLKKIRIGQLQGAALDSGALAAIYPDNIIYSMPAIFDDIKEVDAVRKTIDPLLEKHLDEKGFVSFGIAGAGFSYLMTKSPVANLNELRSKKLWAPGDNGMFTIVSDTMGLKVVSVPLGDVMVSLQTGLINAVTVSPVGALVLQWHTQVKYLTDLPLFYTYGVFAIDKKAFNKLSKEDQKAVTEVFTAKMKKIDAANTKDSIKAKQALLRQGIKAIKPKTEDINNWHQYSEKSIDALVKADKLSKEMVQKLKDAIATYRKQNA